MPDIGMGLAAGAMSQAIGDIYRGRVEALENRPKVFAQAEDLAGAQQQRVANMAMLPQELARSRQNIALGDYQLAMAPEHLRKLRGDIDFTDWQQRTQQAEYGKRLASEETLKTQVKRMLQDPTTYAALHPVLRQAFEANQDNPAVLAKITEKMGEQFGAPAKTIEERAARDMSVEDATDIINKTKVELPQLKAEMANLTRNMDLSIKAGRAEDAAKYHNDRIALQTQISGLTDRFHTALIGVLQQRANTYQQNADNKEGANPWAAAELKTLQSQKNDLTKRRSDLAKMGRTDPGIEAQLSMIDANMHRVTSQLKGAPAQGGAPKTAEELFKNLLGR